ncbi:MAG: hypothetical protein N2559_17190, partial [Anaerolineae bacterium]|nr:hypothetical protein [Anaerolineae bacterium]
NRAYAAAHCTEGPWGKSGRLLWVYNHALTCPRDANGKTCADILIDELVTQFASGGMLEKFDGIAFDVLFHALGNPDARGRAPDADADGIADSGIVGGDNVYGRGVIEFCRQLRARLGDARLILADGQSAHNQRAFGILNGIEAEGWPHLRDARVDDWSGGLNRQTFWKANARAPQFSYVNHKFQTDNGDFNSHAQFPYATHRLVFAGAVFTDSAICYSLLPPTEKDELVGVWDELWMGQARKLGWLGQPLAPAVHLAEKQNNLLADWTITDLRAHLRGDVDVVLENDVLKISASTGDKLRFALTLPTHGEDLLVVFTARALGDIARLVQIHFGSDEPSAFWVNQHAFKFYHYRGDVRANPVELNFTVEGNAPFWLERLAAYAFPDVMYREFENGLVLANPSLHAFTFDLPTLFPNQVWQRLRGSPQQDPHTNDGSLVQGALTLSLIHISE